MSLFFVAAKIKQVLDMDNHIKNLAMELYQKKSILLMGREITSFNFATCLEGALVR